MNKGVKAVVLAAGKSKRMKSDKSKVVHKILGKEIINYILDSLVKTGINDNDIIVVVGENREEVMSVINRNVNFAVQKQQLGTADALMAADEYLEEFNGDVLVTVGDNPYITSDEFLNMLKYHRAENLKCTLLSSIFPNNTPPYGRIIRDENNLVTEIIEAPDASDEQLKIREVNAGIYLFDYRIVFPLLRKIGSENKKGEFYLTDIVSILKDEGFSCGAVIAENNYSAIGINNRWELAEAQRKFNEDNLMSLALESGITILQPETVTIEKNVKIGKDTTIFPSTYIGSGTSIGKNCKIGPFSYLRNVNVEDNEEISYKKITG